MNTEHRKPLPGTQLDYFDTRAAVEAIQAGAYDKLHYTSPVLAEQLVRRSDPAMLTDALTQIVVEIVTTTRFPPTISDGFAT